MIKLDSDELPNAIIRMGARIFSDGRNPKDGTSLAVTRRQARQMRRRRDRLLKRKARMLAALIRLGFFPEDKHEREKLVRLDPYLLRKKGLDESLTGPEFGRALFHINQRRGFLSNRKTDKNDNDSGTLKTAISKLRETLEQEKCRTLGEWLYNRHQQQMSVRARLRGNTQKDRAYDFYVDRAMIEHEFDTLWERQYAFNPVLFNHSSRDELKDILLFQRSLKPVKPGRCTLLPNEERAPLALPSTQRFRIYQEVNNLRILSPTDLREQKLTLDQRDEIIELLEKQKETSFSKIRTALKLPGTTQFNLEDIKRTKLKGNLTSAILSKKEYFGELWHRFSDELQNNIVNQLLNEPSETVLVQWLKRETDINASHAEQIINAKLPEGYGSLSSKALARIQPKLRAGVISYAEAVTQAGFESHSALSHSEATGEIMSLLPYYGDPLRRHVAFAKEDPKNDEERYGKIANPTVHIGLNELRKVVNALIQRYGHPSEVIVEVARELKLSRDRKFELQKEQASRQKRNELYLDEACEVLGLTPETLGHSKRREISQKMQLWYELNPANVADRKCPYTGEPISIERLFSIEVEIEHIFPYSRTLDDSLNNKTVSLSRANRDKGNKTPYEAFGENQIDGYSYNAILERAALMPTRKKVRFAPDGYQRWLKEDKDFLARSLNDTAYLSRIAKEYLSLICPPNKVRAIPGRMTATLRGKFGLNQLLSGSSIKNRNDHRHHALDAAVIGITDQGMLQRFAKASANAKEKQLDRLIEEIQPPWLTYREHVERALNAIKVSHRPDHSYQGAMHEETAWGLRGDGKVSRRIQPEGGGPRNRKDEQKKVIKINSTRNPQRHSVDEQGQPKPYKGYIGGSNYCIEIWKNDKGKWNGDVISTFQAYQIIRQLGEKEGELKLRDRRQCLNGKPLVIRLMINDMLRLNIDGKTRLVRIVKMGGNGQIFMCDHHEANVDARNRDKNDSFAYISKTSSSLQKARGRQVSISEIGDLRDRRFKG